MSFIAAAIIGGGALAAGGSIVSGIMGSNAAKSAADAQVQAAQTAANTQLSIFNQTQQNLAPYNQFGQSAISQLARMFGLGGNGTPAAGSPLGQLASIYGIGTGGPSAATAANATSALTQYPGYQFGLNQGVQALDRSAASQGLLLSGGQLKAAQQYGQGYAMQNAWNPYVSGLTNYVNNYNSSLAGFANLGENAAATTGAQGVATGQGVAQSQLAAGQAAASGIIGSNNALTGGLTAGLNTGLNSALLGYALNNNPNVINSGLGSPYAVSNGGFNYMDAAAGTGL